MTDELAPLFESRETRLGRLPTEARSKLELAATAAPDQTDFVDKQFVSLWLARRVGMPRQDILNNFDKITARFFGDGATAATAYDRIAANYKPASDETTTGAAANGPKASDEYVPTEGLSQVGKGFFGQMIDGGQSARAVASGFTGFAQQVPAGLYSEAAAVNSPRITDPFENRTYLDLNREKELILRPAFSPPGVDKVLTPEETARVAKIDADMAVLRGRTNDENKAKIKAFAGSQAEGISTEYRRLANFWYNLSEESDKHMGVDPVFAQTTVGQFMKSAGSVPATAAMAALGPVGWAGMEGSFYAQVESERQQVQGAAYDPNTAIGANLASAVPQLILENALGVERLMNKVLTDIPKHGGKVLFGDFVKQTARTALVAAVEEGVENPAQGAWNDYMASLSYDQKREVLTGEGAKKRLVEGVSGFVLGGFFGGAVKAVDVHDTNSRVNAGQEYLTTRDGQPLSGGDFNLLRSIKSDQEILAQAPDHETGQVLLAAANGDAAAQVDYNKRVTDKLFVPTEGHEVGGLSLGQVNDVPVVKMSDGSIVPLDMTSEEDRSFVDNMKREVARQAALNDTADFLKQGMEPGRELVVSQEAKTLQTFIDEAKLNVDEAAKRIGIAQDVNEANLPAGVAPADVAVLGSNISEYQQGIFKDVSHVYEGGNALTAVEEVAEGYIKKRLAVGDVVEQEVAAWRSAYEAATATKTVTTGSFSNIEWFSKRVVDYAVANRKAEGMPKSLNGFFRTLGEHLKTVFRLAQRIVKLKRDGKLPDNFENHLKGALGLMTPAEVAHAKQAGEYNALFGASATSEGKANAATAPKLAADLQAQDLMLTRANAEATPTYGITAELSPQAQRMAEAEGYGDMSFSLAPLPGGQLIAVHNTTAEKLRHIADLGGMAVPSVAIIKPGVSKFTSFGDISVVLPPAMVNPRVERSARVFNADVYSPRFPQNVRFKINDGALRRAWTMLGKVSKELGFVLSSEVDYDEVEKQGIQAFQDSSAVMLAFVKDKGMQPEVKYKEVQSLPPELLAFDGTRWEIADNPKFQKAAAVWMDAQLKGAAVDPEIRDSLFTDGKLNEKTLLSIAQDVVLTKKPEVDRYATATAVKEQIAKAGLNEEFTQWVKDKFSDVIKQKVLRDYNERTDKVRNLPYNLDSVVEVMKRDLRDGEGFNYGVASIRSNVALEFKTVSEMKKAGDQIVTPEQMAAVKEETNNEFMKLAEKLAPFYRFEANRFGYLDEVSTAFKELATDGPHKFQENFKDVPAPVMKEVTDFLTKLSNMPTEYFEGKIQRGVRLEEMAGAIIPSDTPGDVRSLLEKAGLRLIEYPKGDMQARTEALSQFSDMSFALTGQPQTETQALQAQAERIRAKRLAASGQLLKAIQAGQTIPKRVAAVRRTTQASLLARIGVPLTSRLADIHPSLKNAMRKFEFGLGQHLVQDIAAVTPLLKGMEGMKTNDAAMLDLALKNGDTTTRDTLLQAYGLKSAHTQVEALLEQTRARAVAAGYDVGQIKDYFPRHVLDVDGLMAHYYGKPQAGHIEEAIRKAGEAALAQGRVLTPEDRVDVVNTALRGYGPKEGGPSHTKGRKTDVVDMNANAYYADSAHALIHYIESMNAAIEKRAFFGKSAQNLAPTAEGVPARLNLEASIGSYVETLIANGDITRAQQREVSDLLDARFSTQASSDFVKTFKTLGYITTMGKVTSALSQVQDLAFSLYENGVFDTMVATARAGVKQSKITKAALGLDVMAEEFRDVSKLSALLNTTFKITGLNYIDGIGKEALVSAKFAAMSREAARGKLSPRSTQIINTIFDPSERAQVIADLAAGKTTQDTMFAVWNVLADYQPIAASEYPEAYLRHPNGRAFYMLKSYTIKQIDAFRREGITLIVHGNAKQKVQGFRNLTQLAGLLFLVGVPLDWIKDAIMGRDPQLSDVAVDNVFKLMGVSRWNLWRFRDHKDPVKAAMELVTPPAPFLSYPIADAFDAAAQISKGDDIKPGEFESWKLIPFFGDPIYWLLGGGRAKVEKRRLEMEKRASSARVGLRNR